MQVTEFERKKKAEESAIAEAMELAGMHPCWGCGAPVAHKGDLCSGCRDIQQDAAMDAWDDAHPEERCPPRE